MAELELSLNKLIEEFQEMKTVSYSHIEVEDTNFHDGAGIGINSEYFEGDDNGKENN